MRTVPYMSYNDFNSASTIYEAVLAAVTGTPRSAASIIAEVTSATGAAAGSVSAQLSELVSDGVLLRPSRGKYCFNVELLGPEAREALGADW
jgi:hypothetical protein